MLERIWLACVSFFLLIQPDQGCQCCLVSFVSNLVLPALHVFWFAHQQVKSMLSLYTHTQKVHASAFWENVTIRRYWSMRSFGWVVCTQRLKPCPMSRIHRIQIKSTWTRLKDSKTMNMYIIYIYICTSKQKASNTIAQKHPKFEVRTPFQLPRAFWRATEILSNKSFQIPTHTHKIKGPRVPEERRSKQAWIPSPKFVLPLHIYCTSP